MNCLANKRESLTFLTRLKSGRVYVDCWKGGDRIGGGREFRSVAEHSASVDIAARCTQKGDTYTRHDIRTHTRRHAPGNMVTPKSESNKKKKNKRIEEINIT